MERVNQIEFLYKAIADVQELIKFTESKAAFVVGIITAFVAVLFVTFENVIKYYSYWSFIFWIFYVSLMILMICCIWIIAKIIMPINNANECIQISKKDIPETEFYLAFNKYKTVFFPFFNSQDHKLHIKYRPYYQKIKDLDDNAILKILTLELFKISFIRNYKSDRLKILIYFILITTIALILFYIAYQIELAEILELLKAK
jgi:hypothetical protein